ncbi:glycosyltransferase [Luteimicrobium subarcticum]|uniref:D-inositol 3-phosphate glycosyltransferase n=1 Tax=Luteimicrobium subarcticum TaxID=620910 RepID=A0A2M8WTI6_9MICO|nr:glycosyltransferase [Luteimicrobium subarcticum]PJI94263.1 glycosyltransferase involved in cell wall biosynthesis [Luteimicrobium subarcticum]
MSPKIPAAARRRVDDLLVRYPTVRRTETADAMRRERIDAAVTSGGTPDASLLPVARRFALEGGPVERYRSILVLMRLDARDDAVAALHRMAADAPQMKPWDQVEVAQLLARHTLVDEADEVYLAVLRAPAGGVGLLGAARYAARDGRPEIVGPFLEAVDAGRTAVRGKTGDRANALTQTLRALHTGASPDDTMAAAAGEPEAVRAVARFALRTRDRGLAVALGDHLGSGPIDDPETAGFVARLLDQRGDIGGAVRLAEAAQGGAEDPTSLERLITAGTADLAVLRDGWTGGPRLARTHEPEPRKAAYLLHNSLPFDSGGYATRSHGILSALTAEGWDMDVLNRPGYPWDRPRSLARGGGVVEPSQRIDGVRYSRLSTGPAGLDDGVTQYVERYADAVVARNATERYGVIHAASFFRNGLGGIRAARRLGIPSVYEVRGTHDLSNSSKDLAWLETDRGRLYHTLEGTACIEADRVFVITRAVRDVMIDRGVAAEKIRVLPNGVDSSRFGSLPRDADLARELGVEGYPVIGYVGSMVFYEGLELLVEAAQQLHARGVKFKMLLVGDGDVAPGLREQVVERGLSDVVIFTGRVPHHDVERYYSLIDVAPFPRTSSPVTEAVSPLKPFEALAMQRAVVVSSVGALTEIITDGENGLVFRKDDVGSLVEQLERLVLDESFRLALAERGREWVVRERDWRVVVGVVDETYRELSEEFGLGTRWLDALPGAVSGTPAAGS